MVIYEHVSRTHTSTRQHQIWAVPKQGHRTCTALTYSKAISNAMKARGLTRLRWYCQICSKACRDANGYKCHIESEAHMRQLTAAMGEGGQRAGKVVHDYSSQFQHEFVALLRQRYVLHLLISGLARVVYWRIKCTKNTSRTGTMCT